MIIMTDGENSFTHLLHQRQQHLIKLTTEVWILIRRPFIQQDNIAFFCQRQQQRHAFFLPF
ncbi:Uncharacterised protein [Shigella sonnei]|nr:Uncharacterised protein [Shigella sonnei]CSF71359.1 Uncharacterised protein [Shigella sonnei]CSG40480.1 Uncharacterised protein [Shigella sonnei]CSP90375.1 Uncharacterised protein [Shigella sonnei]